ncbi:restriction endonuclease [Priestia megaterium]|uniref:restriction endonuclease n=1 Tax=Priestia megaterium TaxID=1404 RepID=UPI001865CD9F|nr:restriction endonuclease [Priestia megaterium]MBE2973417.1 restriction endonuclease [Priestia megaterium]
MKINQIFAYRRPYSGTFPVIGDLENYFFATYKDGCNLPLLESGINKIASINSHDGSRIPAILISSSPHKIGSSDTPWQDFFDPDNGHIRYYGDNKTPGNSPELTTGNKRLLEAFDVQNSLDFSVRESAVPILFFKRVNYKGRPKGNVMFQGYGIVERAERVTQYDLKTHKYFSNYVFDFAVLSLTTEEEVFNWDWINKRRDPNIPLRETLNYAPHSWKSWIKNGRSALEKNRRRVSKLLTTKVEMQKPLPGSREEKAIKEIYSFYEGKKARFEGLAAVISQKILTNNGSYVEGWITPSSSDGGADFVGRLDIGSGFSTTKLVVLGQAKCEKLATPTNGNHIARTVARLRRGWIGIYVTTSYFSESVQREVIDDAYPIVLVNGLRLAEAVLEMVYEQGFSNLLEFLVSVDTQYESKIHSRRPDEILYF